MTAYVACKLLSSPSSELTPDILVTKEAKKEQQMPPSVPLHRSVASCPRPDWAQLRAETEIVQRIDSGVQLRWRCLMRMRRARGRRHMASVGALIATSLSLSTAGGGGIFMSGFQVLCADDAGALSMPLTATPLAWWSARH